MTIAATNFLAVLTGGTPAAGAAAPPVAGFSAAIGTALAEPVAVPFGGSLNSVGEQPVLATGLLGKATIAAGEPMPGTETAIVGTAEPAQPQTSPESPAPAGLPIALHELDKPTVCADLEPAAKAQVPVAPDSIPIAETEIPADDIPEGTITPEPALPALRGDEAKFPVAAPWVQVARAVPMPAEPSSDAEIAQPSPNSFRLRHTAENQIDATHGPTSPVGATGFFERVPLAAVPTPAPEGAAVAPTQMSPIDARPAAAATEPALRATPPEQPIVNARSGQIGREMGVEIARHLSAGGDELTVRLNPAEMGRIEVRLSFDEGGTLRAVVAAESAAALEMLRRDQADLGRALTDAGVRADAQSFRFDSRSGGGEGGQFWQRQQQGGRDRRTALADDVHVTDPVYRPLRASGRVDLMA